MTDTPKPLNAPTASEILSFIETLDESYTYDPPERWRNAYSRLRALRPRFQAAHQRYGWLSLVSLLVLLATVAALLFGIIPPVFASSYSMVMFFLIPSLFDWLATLLARRREPLLRFEDKINGACAKFDKLLMGHSNAPA